jgi:4-amino-4-deoxy-L-arabinose transferase-like glycosyltransferase
MAFDNRAWTDGARRYEMAVGVAILVFILARLLSAANAPLAFDEALYWRWSKHLAGGYLDHPPMNPLLIRIGTSIFGDTEFGVRVMAVLLGLPATWAVWRSAAILFGDSKVGATAALFFNLTLAMAAGSMLATPDSIVVVTSSFLLFFLVKVSETGRGAWWLAVGVVFGLGMFSKYSTIFFAVSILAWLLLVPELRKWLFNPWPWVGAVIALAIFSPVLIWNAQHGWASVLFQSERLKVYEWTLRYFGEFFASQLGLATPAIFVLGCMGLVGILRQKGEPYAARMLISAMVWPIVLYFTWHSFHGRVEGNWPEPMYPAFVIAAAVAADRLPWRGAAAWWALWSRRFAAPVGIVIAAFVYLQAVFAIVPLGSADPTARILGAGWPTLGVQIDELRARIGARIILTADYGVSGWLAFYVPSRTPVEQINGRMRWVDAPQPDPELFRGSMLYVCKDDCGEAADLAKRFKLVEHLATLTRTRRGVAIAQYPIYRLTEPLGPVLERP